MTIGEMAKLAELMELNRNETILLPTLLKTAAQKLGMSRSEFGVHCFERPEVREYLVEVIQRILEKENI